MDGAVTSVGAGAWTLGRLFSEAGLGACSCAHFNDVPLTQLDDDSRQVMPGSCFVAVRGGNFDGHDLVPAAIEAGATSVVVERSLDVPPGVALVKVPDTRAALSTLAAAYCRLLPGQRATAMKLVGITGTNGKSTTCDLLRSILMAADQRAALLGTIRYDLLSEQVPASLTTPPALELCKHLGNAADAGAQWAVMEVSSHALDQRRCDGLDFSAGVFTNISGDHLDYHGDTCGYVRAKKRLFDGLAPNAVAVVNADDEWAVTMAAHCQARVVRFGLENTRAEVTAEIGVLSAELSQYVITFGDGFRVPVTSGMIGRHNVMNALAAAATARALGIGGQAIRDGIEAVSVVRGRLEHVRMPGQDFAVLVDYAHTDDALRRVLSALRPLTRGRLICVFGCGGDRDRTKRPRMAAAVDEAADVAVVTSDNPRTEDPVAIIDEILSGFALAARCRVDVEPDRGRAISRAIGHAEPGDTVLIAGKGHEDYQIIGTARRHFDDAEEARLCLGRRLAGAGVAS